MGNITGRYKSDGGSVIAYRLIRSGASENLLVLLHGLASNMTRWSEFTELTGLRKTWDILLIDLRGHGDSQYRGKITMEEWCSDIAGILRVEGYSGAVVGGHCLGANIAVYFSHLYPELCKGLVLLEPLFQESFTGALKRVKSHKFILSLLIGVIRFFNAGGLYRRTIPPLDLRELDREARKLIAEAGSAEVLTKRYGSPIDDLRYISGAAYFQSVRELLRPLPDLERINIPKLFIFSSGRLFTESENIDETCASLQNCSVVEIDSYHWVPTEKPEELMETIERWCMEQFG